MNRRWIVVLGAVAFLIAGLRPVASQMATPAPLSLLLLLDVSASVDSHLLELPRDISGDVDSDLLGRLQPADRFGVGAFGATLKLSGFLPNDRKVRTAAVRSALRDRSVGMNGPSRIWDALEEGITALEKEPDLRAIILVTDGYSTGNRVGLTDVIRRAQAANVVVSVIANKVNQSEARKELGPSSLGSAWPLLERLAAETRGELKFDEWGDTFRPRKPGQFFEELLARLRARPPR
jgi:hypothetical protein